MSAHLHGVLRGVRFDPCARVLGRLEPADAHGADPVPPGAPARNAADGGDDVLLRRREDDRRLAAEAFDRERARDREAQASALARAIAEVRSEADARVADAERAATAAAARADALHGLAAAIDAALATARAALLDDAVLLAYEATGRFVGAAATDADAGVRADRLRALVAQASAAHVGGGALLRLRVHPEDAALLDDRTGALPLVADPAVARGGCTLDAARGRLDVRLETAFDALRAAWSAEHPPA